MLRLTLAQMRSNMGRLVAAGIAVLLGSAFVTAALTAGDVITRGAYDAATATYGTADLIVDRTDEPPLSEVLDRVRSTPGVAAADPALLGWADLRSGRRSVSQTVIPVPSVPELGSLQVASGRAPVTATEIALPTSTAERLGVGVGDTVVSTWREAAAEDSPASAGVDVDDAAGVLDEEQVERTADVRVVGLVEDPRGAWSRYGGAALATTDAVVTWSGFRDIDAMHGAEVLVLADHDVATVQAALVGAVPEAGVATRDEAAVRTVENLGGGDVIAMVALGFAAVALLVAALVISNTFQVVVAQRTRMLALLRCVGARRGQLRAAVLLEAGILGLVSGTAGVLTGLALSQGSLVVLSRVQGDVPLPAQVQPSLGSTLVPVLVAVAVTVGAALVPARAATRVSPVAALRPADAPTVRARPGRVRLVVSALLVLAGSGALVGGVVMGRAGVGLDAMLPLALGVLGGATSFVGLLVGAPLWIPPIVSAVGRPVSAISASARLAAANTVRNPRRTAATSTALVIGVTLVVMMSTGAVSAQAALAQEMDERSPVDLMVLGEEQLDADVVSDVAGLDAVATAVPARRGGLESPDGLSQEAVVVDPASADLLLRDPAAAAAIAGGRSVAPHGWSGDEPRLTVRAPATGGPTTQIDVVRRDGKMILLTADAADALQLPDATSALLVRLADGADATTALQDVQDVMANDAVVVISDAADRQGIEQVIDVMLAIVIGLLGVAVVIALIGVTNTLSLSVIERRRESATLRAVGLSRRGLRAMLATEGMLIAGVGALIGSVLGLLYGWAGAATVFGPFGDVRLAVPWAHLAAVLAVAVVAGLAASALPARAAARTPPVAALGVD
ncbi:ABC transporter permease [Cellulomonas sp. zg-ZUI199]|uniref:ABC transporter permease n=1 Tax=Cellulomonas wangleii TaxID=2816956 RepID=A0ABX8D656_9CELL|nr:ABC transporter permease [Cellulomonas wangleii]MBO0925271.1 ABC transporter permease [Cellulomonas wangleii]QVI61227.1 ABC transporter permease [Cellulomonas wangleii]